MGDLMTFANIATQFSELLASRPEDAERAKELMVSPTVKNMALEEAYLAAHLTEAQSALGNDDPYVKTALMGQMASPERQKKQLLIWSKTQN